MRAYGSQLRQAGQASTRPASAAYPRRWVDAVAGRDLVPPGGHRLIGSRTSRNGTPSSRQTVGVAPCQLGVAVSLVGLGRRRRPDHQDRVGQQRPRDHARGRSRPTGPAGRATGRPRRSRRWRRTRRRSGRPPRPRGGASPRRASARGCRRSSRGGCPRLYAVTAWPRARAAAQTRPGQPRQVSSPVPWVNESPMKQIRTSAILYPS